MEKLRGVLWRAENALPPVFPISTYTMQPNPVKDYVQVSSSEPLSLGSVMEVIDQRGKIDNTKLSNDALETIGVFESVQQQMNSLWLETIGKGILELDSVQWETAMYWAMQCPLEYGPGVYTARGIVASKEHYSYNDSYLCQPAGLQFRQGVEQPSNENEFYLQPNPTTNYAILTSKEPIDTDGQLVFYDLLGKPCKVVLVAKGSSLTDIELDSLLPGVYSAVLRSEAGQLQNWKMVVIRQ